MWVCDFRDDLRAWCKAKASREGALLGGGACLDWRPRLHAKGLGKNERTSTQKEWQAGMLQVRPEVMTAPLSKSEARKNLPQQEATCELSIDLPPS